MSMDLFTTHRGTRFWRELWAPKIPPPVTEQCCAAVKLEETDECRSCGEHFEPQEEDRCPECGAEGFMVRHLGYCLYHPDRETSLP